jgi:hypothetical protein
MQAVVEKQRVRSVRTGMPDIVAGPCHAVEGEAAAIAAWAVGAGQANGLRLPSVRPSMRSLTGSASPLSRQS